MFIRFDMIHEREKKSLFSRTAAHIFLFPLETSLRLSRNMLHGWKANLMLAKPLAVCTYLSSIVSELLTSMRKSKNRYFYHIFVPLGQSR